MLYHFEKGITANIRTRFGYVLLSYSKHAERAANDDRYAPIETPLFLDTNAPSTQVIEVETDSNNKATKIVYRIPYSLEFDLCLAVSIRDWRVKTVWLNESEDCHRTVDLSRYDECVAV
jgi:hypothetical protein